MNLQQAEQIVLGYVLRYGAVTLPYLLPDLTPDHFIYGPDGLGTEHRTLWTKIREARTDPSIAHINYLTDYCQTLTHLEQAGIYAFDPASLLEYAEVVYKAGTVWRVLQSSQQLAQYSKSEGVFDHYVNSISDLNSWLTSVVESFQFDQLSKTGYTHIGEIVDATIQDWDRQFEGEQLVILPVGIPIFMSAQLFPLGQLAILHGMTGTGKSALLLTILLGTALGLKANNVQGCVALNSLEMSSSSLVRRCASLLAGIDGSRLLGGKTPLSEEEYKKFKAWARFVQSLPIYIDDTNLITTDAIRYGASSLHSTHGPLYQLGTDYSELFIDPLENKEQRIEHVARNHFAIARTLNTSVIMISQSTYENNKFRIAGLNGLRWSRGASMAANIIFELINYPAMRNNNVDYKVPESMDDTYAWVQVQKYRDGQTTQFSLGWEGPYTRFYDLDVVRANYGRVTVYDHLKKIPEAVRLLEMYNG